MQSTAKRIIYDSNQSFTWERLMSWLRAIDRSVKVKLLPKMWVTLLVFCFFLFLLLESLCRRDSSHYKKKRWKCQVMNFASCHAIRMNVRKYFTALWQLIKCGMTVKQKPQFMVIVFGDADGFIHVDFLEPGIYSEHYLVTFKILKKHKKQQKKICCDNTFHKQPERQL